jgi:gluconolactonase
MSLIKLLMAIPLLCSGIVFGQKINLSDIIDPASIVEKLSDGFLFAEGPAADNKGNVFFTDQPNDRIMEWSLSDQLTVFIQPSGHSNGMAFDSEGNLWSCADEKNELWCIDSNKNVSIIPSKYAGKPLNGPNDLWIAPDGGIYFTDPFYKRTWWDHDIMPQSCQAVYYLKPDHKSIIRIIDDMVQPNGIVGTPDGRTLFIADIGAGLTWSYKLNSDGTPGEKKLFCEMGSDGMTIDAQGNIYLTGRGVTIFESNGSLIGNIPVPENWTANVCFGGRDMKSLFITAGKSLYRIRTKIKGAY